MTTTATKIISLSEVRVVEASAGSGKTFALARRYVQLLLNPAFPQTPIPMRHILAITFTNKAAFEMKARILDFLKKIALKSLAPDEEKEILGPLALHRDAASRRAFGIMEEVIHHYNFFQVQTIDSFINALLSGCAFKLGLSANFKIKRNYLEYLQYSLDQIIDVAAHDRQTYQTFEQFLHQYLFLENKTGWFPKKDMLDLLGALYLQGNTYGLDFIPYEQRDQDLIVKKRKILSLIQKLQEGVPEGTDKRFLNSLESFLGKYTHGFDFDRVPDYFAREEFPVRKGVDVSPAIKRLWTQIRNQLMALSEDEAYSLFNPYIAVFEQVIEEFHRKAARDDVLFLSALNRKARFLFDETGVTVEELYYRLATRFHHYLLDEFQDTSILQWRNLFMMIEEALSTGGSLFYVGDKKQAIYGFRGGEVKLFDHIQDQFDAFNVQTERLGRNFRSQKAVVDFNNTIFSMDNLRRFVSAKEEYEAAKKKRDAVLFTADDFQAIGNIFHSSQQGFQPGQDGGYVKIEYVDIEKKDDRNEVIRHKLIEGIRELTRRFSHQHIAILTRSNQEVELITTWLLAEGIFVESERTLNIREDRVVQELLAFLRFLNSPIDNPAFAQFIVGGIFSKATGIPAEQYHRFIFSLRRRISEEKDLYIYKEFRDAFPDVWDRFIDEFFKNVGLYPLYELIISIINRFSVLTHFARHQGFVMRFLELIMAQEEENTDIASFLETFEALESEELYVKVAASDSIKILTIHKSKGLEFPVVMIPFLGMDIHIGSGGGSQLPYILDFSGRHLLRIKNKYLRYSEKLSRIYQEEYKKAFLSELNNIYVALTRAQQELYAFIPKRTGNSFNFVNFLIPPQAVEMGVRRQQEEKKEEVPRPQQPLAPSQYHDWIDFLQDEFGDFQEVVRRDVLRKGEVLHLMLSFIGNIHQKDKAVLREDALHQARCAYPHISDFASCEACLKQLLETKSLEKFFSVSDGEVFQEVDVVNPKGHTKRLDRLIVKTKEVWIVDYKSSQQDTGRYQKQVGEYMEIAKDLYPGRAIKGFLIYLDELTCEQI